MKVRYILNVLIVSLLLSSVGAGLYTRVQAEELRAWILSHWHRASWCWVYLLWKQRNREAQTQEMWLGSVSGQHQTWRGEELSIIIISLNLHDNLKVNLCKDQVEDLLQGMRENGFSSSDYDVFQNSCNTFTEVTRFTLQFPESGPGMTPLKQWGQPQYKPLRSTSGPILLT